MRNLFKIAAIALLFLPLTASAISVSWDRPAVGRINPINILDTVFGNIFHATSTTQASIFPYATTTVTSADRFCLTADTCISIWPSGGSSFGYPFPNNATTTVITFSNGLTGNVTGNVTGNAGTVTNGVYTTGLGSVFVNGSGTSGNCVQWGASNALADAGAPCGSGSGGSGVATTSLLASLPITVTKTTASITFGSLFGTTSTWGLGNNGFVVTGATGIPFIAASSTLNLPNSALANSSLTVNTTAPLSGGGSVSLGGAITITCASCSTTAGTVTSVATNNGLTGGPITSTGTVGLDVSGLSVNALTAWSGSKLVATGTPQLTVGYVTATSTTATSTFAYSINLKSGGDTTNGIYLSRPAFIFSTSTPGTNVSVVFSGSRDSAPSFSAGTLTLANNTQTIQIIVWGGGGGGGGALQSNGAGGGGGGGCSEKMYTPLLGQYFYNIGAGGAGGIGGATGHDGTNGSTSSFGTGLATSTSNGGGLGQGAAGNSRGGTGGTSSGGDIFMNGGAGNNGGVPEPGGGAGGSACLGGGGGGQPGFNSSDGNGGVGSPFGGGGGAPFNNSSGTNNGGNGGNGGLLITGYTF